MTTMTRGAFALKLAQTLGLDMTGGGDGGFTDAGMYGPALAALKAAGIITGTSVGTFSTTDTVTREQAATMFSRAFSITGTASTFGDVDADAYYGSAVAGLQDAGIFSGYDNGLFGVGDAFQLEHFKIVVNNLETEGFLGDEPPPPAPPPPPPTEPVQVVEPSIEPADSTVPDVPPIDEDAFLWAAAYLEDQFDLADMGDFVTAMAKEFGTALTQADIDLRIRLEQPFIDRFGAVMDGRRAADMNAISPMEILNFEDAAKATMRASGMPPGFFDEQSDFHDMLIADVSVSELQDRIAEGFLRVQNAPMEIRAAFADLSGVNGDEALAAFFLDPDRAMPAIEKQVTSAEISGSAAQNNISVNTDVVDRLYRQGVDRNLAFTGFARLDSMNAIFQEKVGESTDLTVEQGIEAEFFRDAEATREIQGRIQTRQQAFAGGGGAAATQEGVIGAGTAR